MSARCHLVFPVLGSEQVQMANITGSDREIPGRREQTRPLRAPLHIYAEAATSSWIPFADHEFAAGQAGDTAHASAGTESAQAGHANAAPDETKELADEMREILREAGHPSPASDVLYAEIGKRFQAETLSSS
jgi:hypothetical protein